MVSTLAIVEVLQWKPPLICFDKVGDRNLEQLRATPTINSNVFEAVRTLNDDQVLIEAKVKADVVLKLRHIPLRHLIFAPLLAHLDNKICAGNVFLKNLGKLRAPAGAILRDNCVRNRSVNFIWEDKLQDQKLRSWAGSVCGRRCGGDKWRCGHWHGWRTGWLWGSVHPYTRSGSLGARCTRIKVKSLDGGR